MPLCIHRRWLVVLILLTIAFFFHRTNFSSPLGPDVLFLPPPSPPGLLCSPHVRPAPRPRFLARSLVVPFPPPFVSLSLSPPLPPLSTLGMYASTATVSRTVARPCAWGQLALAATDCAIGTHGGPSLSLSLFLSKKPFPPSPSSTLARIFVRDGVVAPASFHNRLGLSEEAARAGIPCRQSSLLRSRRAPEPNPHSNSSACHYSTHHRSLWVGYNVLSRSAESWCVCRCDIFLNLFVLSCLSPFTSRIVRLLLDFAPPYSSFLRGFVNSKPKNRHTETKRTTLPVLSPSPEIFFVPQ